MLSQFEMNQERKRSLRDSARKELSFKSFIDWFRVGIGWSCLYIFRRGSGEVLHANMSREKEYREPEVGYTLLQRLVFSLRWTLFVSEHGALGCEGFRSGRSWAPRGAWAELPWGNWGSSGSRDAARVSCAREVLMNLNEVVPRMGGAVRHCPEPHPCLPLLLQRASAPLSLAPTHVQRRWLFLLFPLSIHHLFKCQDKNVPGHFPSLFNESAVPLDLQMADKQSDR